MGLARGLGLYFAYLGALVVGFFAVDFLMNIGRPSGEYFSIFGNANGAMSRKETLEGAVGTVVPVHGELKIGTLKGILELARVSSDEFARWL